VRVLQSFPDPRPTSNPYVVMLRRSLDDVPDVDVRTFTWRRALLGRYDVFHVHWPEVLLAGRTPLRVAKRRVLLLLLLLRLRLTGTAVVRTVHNLRPHEETARFDALLLRLLDRLTRVHIRLNEDTPVPADAAAVTVPHGHYRDWYADHPVPEPIPGRVSFVGLIRPYKNVDALVAAFRDAANQAPSATLQVSGGTSSPELAERLTAAAGADPRISLTLRFLDDAELVRVVGQAQLVALPYREMHNSGATLLALSLGRPVLVPRNETNARLAAEVGPAWVLMYDGDLTAETLLSALADSARISPDEHPDLSAREWAQTGRRHLAAYRMARSTG
jgi:glycosyltransferase involved in cell wall biosynthesis